MGMGFRKEEPVSSLELPRRHEHAFLISWISESKLFEVRFVKRQTHCKSLLRLSPFSLLQL